MSIAYFQIHQITSKIPTREGTQKTFNFFSVQEYHDVVGS